jgi:hypothetical protein
LHAPQPIVKLAEPEEVPLASLDAWHTPFSGHLLDCFQVAPQVNCGFFRCKQRFEVLLIVRFDYLLLHVYCLLVQPYSVKLMCQSIVFAEKSNSPDS